MPVTKTAKRALRGSIKKEQVNKLITSSLEIAVRRAKKEKSLELIKKASSLADRAAKKQVIHKNKAARIKSQLSKLMPRSTKTARKNSKSQKLKNSKQTTK
jgi:small subunit ribosomal protein S20